MGFWSEATACALRNAISCPQTVPRPKSSRSSATTAITARKSSPVTTTFPTQRPEALPALRLNTSRLTAATARYTPSIL